MKLEGKSVFVTGGAGGIGSVFCRSLVENGAQVCIADIDEVKGKEVTDELNRKYGKGKAIFVLCDVTNANGFRGAFHSAVAKMKGINVMVNNAGILNENTWEKMLAANLVGTVTGTYLAMNHMRKDNGGQGGVILNMSAISGLSPFHGAPVYTATNHGIIGFTRSVAASPDIDRLGIRLGCICPEIVDTPLLDIKPSSVCQRFYEDMVRNIEANRMKPDAVVEGLLSLIDDDDSNDTLLIITKKNGLTRKKITFEDV